MMEQTLVSVVIPVYNTPEAYLRSCIQSVCEQKHQLLEVIVVDDGSNEETAKLCDDLAAQDSRILVIHKKNGGVSVARNTGIEVANGAYLCFVDSDDMLHPEYVSRLLQGALAYDVAITACDPWIGEESDPSFSALEDISAVLYPKEEAWKQVNWGFCWNKLYRADLLKDIRYQPGLALLEDFLFVNQCLLETDSCAKVDAKLYYYRKNNDSATRRMKPEKYVEAIAVCDRVYEMYAEKQAQEQCNYLAGFRGEWHVRYLVALASQKNPGWRKLAGEERKTFLERTEPYKAAIQSKLVVASLVMAKLPSGLFALYLQLLDSLRRRKK